jgi:glucuronoarabinoxylan endo-1,4-beta-xylanase
VERSGESGRRLPSLPLLGWLGLAASVALGSCGSGSETETQTTTPTAVVSEAAAISINGGQQFQSISGFGASSAWHSTPPTDAEADQLFSAETGAGLSLLRMRIAPDGTTWEQSTAVKARDRGARLWAAPWSPPGAWKTNGSDSNGGRLRPEFYQPWAERLASLAASLSQSGLFVSYLSAQNEPGWVANWETCEWSPTELLTFIRDHLGPAVAARGLATKILAPETNDWLVFRSYADPLLADPRAASYLGVIAVHHYGGSPFAYTAPAERGKELWETEMSVKTVGVGIASGLEVAQSIHEHLTIANANAWHYWWLTDTNASTAGALIQAGAVTKRLWVMGNYSRFVRPGSYRIGASGGSGVLVTAFRNEAAGTLIVVVANRSAQVIRQPFNLVDVRVSSVTPYVTSETLALAVQAPLSGGTSFSYDLPAQSVTTFVGKIG